MSMSSSLISRHCFLQPTHQIISRRNSSSSDDVSLNPKQASISTSELMDLLEHFTIDNGAGNTLSTASHMQDQVLVEDALIDRFKTLIKEFRTPPSHRYAYNTKLHWNINYGNKIKYRVVISIEVPSDLENKNS